MLYFIKPFVQLARTANGDQTLIDLARTQGEDLGLMTDRWESAERLSNDDDVRVAEQELGLPFVCDLARSLSWFGRGM